MTADWLPWDRRRVMISRIKVVLPLPKIPQTVTIFMIYLSIVCLLMIQIANADGIVKECGLSKFNHRNTQCIPARPVGPEDRTGVVKIFVTSQKLMVKPTSGVIR
jgi:hypothetical protein